MTYEIIAKHETPKGFATRAGRVILVNKGEGFHPFVTAWQGYDEKTGKPENSWCHGHYFADLEAAQADFDQRVETA